AGGRLLHDLPGEVELLAGAVDLRLKPYQLGRAERPARLRQREHPIQPALRLRDLIHRLRGAGLRRAVRVRVRDAWPRVRMTTGDHERRDLASPHLLKHFAEGLLRLDGRSGDRRDRGGDRVDPHGAHRTLLMAAFAVSYRTFITLE